MTVILVDLISVSFLSIRNIQLDLIVKSFLSEIIRISVEFLSEIPIFFNFNIARGG